MVYEEYIKKGKKNPAGNNYFEEPEPPKNKYADLIDDFKNEEETQSAPNPNPKNNLKIKNQSNAVRPPNNASKGNLKLNNEDESTSLKIAPKENTTSNNMNRNNLKNKEYDIKVSKPKEETPPRHSVSKKKGGGRAPI